MVIFQALEPPFPLTHFPLLKFLIAILALRNILSGTWAEIHQALISQFQSSSSFHLKSVYYMLR